MFAQVSVLLLGVVLGAFLFVLAPGRLDSPRAPGYGGVEGSALAQDEIRARAFVVVDEANNELARFSSKDVGAGCVEVRLGRKGSPQIVLFSQPRAANMLIGDPNGSAVSVVVSDVEKLTRISSAAFGEGNFGDVPCVSVSLHRRGSSIQQALTLGGGAIQRLSIVGKEAASLNLDCTEESGASVYGLTRATSNGFRIDTGPASRPSPSVTLVDEAGGQIWQAK